MNGLTRFAAPVSAGVLIIASSALYAVQTNAWGRDEELRRAAAGIGDIPKVIGSWNGTDLKFDPDEQRVAGAVAALSRSYGDAGGSARVNAMLLCGPSGPISVHPPTVCFTAAGYSLATDAKRHDVLDRNGDALGTFWVADFEKTVEGRPERIRTYWGWSSGDDWAAPDRPRFAYAGNTVLYKLYVTRAVTAEESGRGDDSYADSDRFLRQFLPAVDRSAFGNVRTPTEPG